MMSSTCTVTQPRHGRPLKSTPIVFQASEWQQNSVSVSPRGSPAALPLLSKCGRTSQAAATDSPPPSTYRLKLLRAARGCVT